MKKAVKVIVLCAFIVGNLVTLMTNASAVEVVTQKDAKMSLGASLSPQQEQQMRQLMGGNQIPPKNIIKVDGPMVNRYFHDGSTQSTNVYSSAVIVPKPKGFGVQVQVTTPSLIRDVTATTYQNAAITSGAKDVLIKIATPVEVTGTGALAGVYAMLENMGQLTDPKYADNSQKELTIIYDFSRHYNYNYTEINVIFAEIKLEINQYFINHNKVMSEADQEKMMLEIFKKYGIDITDEKMRQRIKDFISSYAESEPAQSRETYDQLNLSIMSQSWDSILNGLDKVLERDTLLAEKRPDYTDGQYYHPIIQAMTDKIFQAVENEEVFTAKEIYAHTFAVEKMLGIPTEREREALNYIRLIAYHYVASVEDGTLGKNGKTTELVADTTKGNWLEYLRRYRALAQDPVLKELVDRVGLMGWPMEASVYDQIERKDDWITMFIAPPRYAATEGLVYGYNPETQEMGVHEMGQDQMTPTNETFDFAGYYGVELQNERMPITEVPADYKLEDNSQKYLDGSEDVAGEPAKEETTSEETTSDETTIEGETTVEETTVEGETTAEETTLEESTLEETTEEAETTVEEITEAQSEAATDFDYQLGDVLEGQTYVDVTVQPNEEYKILFPNGDESQPLVADETGQEQIEFGDASLAPVDSELELAVKRGDQWEVVTTIIVTPMDGQEQPASNEENMPTEEVSQVESLDDIPMEETPEEMPMEEMTESISLPGQTPQEDISEESMMDEMDTMEETEAMDEMDQTPTSLWTPDQSMSLDQFIASWQTSMNQSYDRVDKDQLDMYDVQGQTLDMIVSSPTVDGEMVSLEWVDETTMELSTDPMTLHVFEIYTDGEHVYIFGNYQGQTTVYHADMLDESGQLEFTETKNTELLNGFSQIITM